MGFGVGANVAGIVAVFIPIVALLIPIFALYFDYKKQLAKRQERIKAIEKGIEIPPEPSNLRLDATDYLRRGLIANAVGAGLGIGGFMMYLINKIAGYVFYTLGITVFFVGVALVVFYVVKRKSE